MWQIFSLPVETHFWSLLPKVGNSLIIGKKLTQYLPTKKKCKNLVENQRSISPLSNFGKIFERLMFKDLFNYFHTNELFNVNQVFYMAILGFRSYQGYVFSYFQGFNKVWQDRFLFKLKTYCVKGEVLDLLHNFLHKRNQRVVINGQTSSQELIKSVVAQGQVLGPL